MAKPNFKYQKRQKELAKQQKAEEKRLRKLEKRNQTDDEGIAEAEDNVESAQVEIDEDASERPDDEV